MKVLRTALLAALAMSGVAAAQGIPDDLRGAWYAGSCAAPTVMLHVTGRAAARLPADGPARLWRFATVGPVAGWSVGTARGSEAPRLLLRPDGDTLETAEPDPKTRDARLPGAGVTAERWLRCPSPPTNLVLLHGEGLAVLAALERLEAGCAGEPAACVGAVVGALDVTGDKLLSPAELARFGRGLAWVVAVQERTEPDGLGAAIGLGGLASLAAGRALVDSLDYDGDGRLSAAELGQDRVAFGAAPGTPAGSPLPLESIGPALEALRGLWGDLEALR